MINTAMQAALSNFEVSLLEPEVSVITTDTTVAVNILSFVDTTTIRWEK
jgi:hypothetical protein